MSLDSREPVPGNAEEHAKGIIVVNRVIEALISEGLLPEGFGITDIQRTIEAEVVKPVILEPVWKSQGDRLVALRFHDELGMTEEEYRASLPHFNPQPSQYRAEFDLPLMVETRIPLFRQFELAGIDYRDERKGNVVDITDVPKHPYTLWAGTKSGRKQGFGDKPAVNALKELKDHQVTSPLIEVTNLWFHYPDFFNYSGIGAPGSKYKNASTLMPAIMGGEKPYLYYASDRISSIMIRHSDINPTR